MASAFQILTDSVERAPHDLAIIENTSSYSFHELSIAVGILGGKLKDLGIKPGSCLGISLDKSGDFLTSLFAIWSINCVALSVPTNIPQSEQLRYLQESAACCLIYRLLDDTGGNSEIKIRRVPVDESERVRISSTIPDAAVIRYTSGTTGLSKGVIISHRAVLERTEVCGRLLRLDARDRVVNSLSISYHFVASALSCIRLGATLIDCAPLSGIASDNSVSSRFWDYRPTVIFSDPKTYQLLNRTFPATKVEPAPRLAISTSGTLNSAVSAEFTSNFGIVITPVYGIIEIGLPIWNLSRSPKDSTTLGKCVSPYEFKIVQDTKASLPPETPGELLIRGPGTFSGYIRDGGQVIVQDSNQWFPTGDMVALDHNGVIKYKGRKSALIELDSITLAPDEIESILLQLPEIEDVRVLAESDPERGKVLVALIVLKNREGDIPLSNLEVGSLRSKCLALGLDGIKLPYEFRPVDHIARTGSGKVLRY